MQNPFVFQAHTTGPVWCASQQVPVACNIVLLHAISYSDRGQTTRPNEQGESNQDADSNSSSDSVPPDDLEDDLWHVLTIWCAQPMRKTTCWQQMGSRCSASKQKCLPNATTTAGQNSLQSGAQRYQPNRRQGIGSKKDQGTKPRTLG